MKALIITVAGTATRFNQDTKTPTLKCLYDNGQPDRSLLARILFKARSFDRIVIVGGYLYEDLCGYVKDNFSGLNSKITLVYNPLYREYGSGYSLIKGIEAVDSCCDEIVFVEGDLFFDSGSFSKVVDAGTDVLTTTSEPIRADKSVVFYTDLSDRVHYLYDTSHSYLEIREPFRTICNSGQIWKFVDVNKLKSIVSSLTEAQIQGTNLVIVQKYFGSLPVSSLEIIRMLTWVNCNTVSDYLSVNEMIDGDSES